MEQKQKQRPFKGFFFFNCLRFLKKGFLFLFCCIYKIDFRETVILFNSKERPERKEGLKNTRKAEAWRKGEKGKPRNKQQKTCFQRIFGLENFEKERNQQVVHMHTCIFTTAAQSKIFEAKIKDKERKKRENECRCIDWSDGKEKKDACNFLSPFQQSFPFLFLFFFSSLSLAWNRE